MKGAVAQCAEGVKKQKNEFKNLMISLIDSERTESCGLSAKKIAQNSIGKLFFLIATFKKLNNLLNNDWWFLAPCAHFLEICALIKI